MNRAAIAVKVATMGKTMLRIGGLFSKQARELVELTYQWTAPFVADSRRFEAVFGPIEVTPHAQAVPPTLAAMRTAS
jgi:hypothetical protein